MKLHRLHAIVFVVMATALLFVCSSLASADSGPTSEERISDATLEALRGWEHGDSRVSLIEIEQLVIEATSDAALRDVIEGQFIEVLDTGSTTTAARGFICRQLALIGTDKCVDSLSTMLLSAEHSHMSRYALEKIPYNAAGDALWSIVMLASEDIQVGLVESLGRRRDPRVLELLDIATPGRLELFRAVMCAVGGIANEENKNGLVAFQTEIETVGEETLDNDIVLDGLIRLSESYFYQLDDLRSAMSLATILAKRERREHVRLAGMIGVGRLMPPQFAQITAHNFEVRDPLIRMISMYNLAKHPREGITTDLGKEAVRLAGLGKNPKVVEGSCEALGLRGDPAATEYLAKLVTTEHRPSAMAAVRALGDMHTTDAIVPLAKAAGVRDDAFFKLAVESLSRLRGEDIDLALVEQFHDVNTAGRMAIAKAIGLRYTAEPMTPYVYELLETERSRSVRTALLETLGTLVTADEFGLLVGMLVDAGDANARQAAENALVIACHKLKLGDASSSVLLDAYELAGDDETKASLVRVLGNIGGGRAYALVSDHLNGSDVKLSGAAITAFGEWPDVHGARALSSYLETDRNEVLRSRAFRALINVLDRSSGAAITDDIMKMYRGAMQRAANDVERRLVLQSLGRRHELGAMQLASESVEIKQLRSRAVDVVLDIGERLDLRDGVAGIAVLRQIEPGLAGRQALLDRMNNVINRLEQAADFVLTFQISGPYKTEKGSEDQVIDIAFAPEQGGGDWVAPDATAIAAPGIVDLNKAFGNTTNCCGYLTATLTAPQAMRARLELGSDDGLKVWLNGEVVHSNNAMRGLTIGSDVVEVDLVEGDNVILLKVTQGGGDWKACCRVRSEAGRHIDGLVIH